MRVLLTSFVASAVFIALAHAEGTGVYHFWKGPQYRVATPQERQCSALPGTPDEYNEALKRECEAKGWKWQGRSNWTEKAHQLQKAYEATNPKAKRQ